MNDRTYNKSFSIGNPLMKNVNRDLVGEFQDSTKALEKYEDGKCQYMTLNWKLCHALPINLPSQKTNSAIVQSGSHLNV